MKLGNSQKKRGASILLLSFFLMVVLFLMATSMYRLIPAEMHAANRSHQDLQAHHVADAGIRQSIEWLTDSMNRFKLGEPPSVLPDYSPSMDVSDLPNIEAFEKLVKTSSSPFANAGWRYEVNIDLDPTTVKSSHNFQPRVFHITSTAFYKDKPIRSVDTWVRQSTFASFAYYTHRFLGEFRIGGKRGFAGPVHTNDYFVFNVLSEDQFDPTKSVPYFEDEVTFASIFNDTSANGHGDGNKWVGEKPYDENGTIAGRYESIFAGGKNDLRHKGSIELPSTTDDLALIAYGEKASGPIPTVDGLYVSDHDGDGQIDSGIFYKGDVDQLFMGLDEKGNQMMSFESWEATGDKITSTKTTTTGVKYGPYQSYVPPQYNYSWVCPVPEVWVDPPPSGGVAAGPTEKIKVCPVPLVQKQGSEKKWREVLDPGSTVTTTTESDDWDKVEHVVVEVETDGTTFKYGNKVLNDPVTNAPVTANAGQTIVAKVRQDDEATGQPWEILDVKVMDGMPNGTIFVDGSINADKNGNGGLHGITKGTPQVDDSGQIVKSDGKTQYNSKVIATNLDSSIALSGDLLQFSPEKFAAYGSKTSLDDNFDTRRLKNVALDPNKKTGGEADPELSTTPDHILGIVSKDVWMQGKKTSNNKNGSDGYNDIYAVILAGKSVDPGGGYAAYVVGGFGTYWDQVNSSNGGGDMGNYRILGGVIQGTTGENQDVKSDAWKTAHYWINNVGNKGYQVEMVYDRVATFQRLFPTYAAFEVIRYLERSARG